MSPGSGPSARPLHSPGSVPAEQTLQAPEQQNAASAPQAHKDGDASENPRVLVELSARGPRITAANAAGFQAGAQIGQRLHDARAACPHLQVDYADEEGDAAMLERMTRFALRFSPIVAPDGLTATDAGLMIDTAGCAHLFGGEQAMVETVVARFTQLGFLTLAGLAPTPLAARALARYGHDPDADQPPPVLGDPWSHGHASSGHASDDHCSDEPGKSRDRNRIEPNAFDAFPIEALMLDEDRVTLLTRLGLKTIRALRRVPRSALERRFRSRQAAQSVQLRLDQLFGDVAEPITPIRPPEPYRTALACPEPIMEVTGIEWALRDMLARLEGRLEREGLGARRFRLHAFTVDGSSSQVPVQLSRAGRDAQGLMRLFTERLQAIDPGFGIEAFVLAAEGTEPMDASQTGWVPSVVAGGGGDALRLDEDVMALVDRLANRFGALAAFQLQPVASHVPEQASNAVAAGHLGQSPRVAGSPAAASWQHWQDEAPHTAPRPARLLDRPEPADVVAAIPDGPPAQLVWRRVRRGIVRARGPERIAAPWWQDNGQSADEEAGKRAGMRVRDYYDVEDGEGRRYWVFRAGLYGDLSGDDQAPEWFVHGLFQ